VFYGTFSTNRLYHATEVGNDNLIRTTKRQNTYQRKSTIHKKGP